MIAVLEHMIESQHIFKEVYRVLKKDGIFLLITPSPSSNWILQFLAKLRIICKDEIADHKIYYTPYVIMLCLEKAGFSSIKIQLFQLGFNMRIIAKK